MQSKHTEGFGLKSLEQLPLPLLEWYRDNARTLPWRSDPTPYHVWISEIMLQQTRVAAVLDYYRRFLEELPTVQALAAVEGDFTPSAFVRGITGVDNVCERAAAAAGGRIIVPKQANNGVTAAVARKDML